MGTVAASYAAMLLYIAVSLGGLPSRMTRPFPRRLARVCVLRWVLSVCVCVREREREGSTVHERSFIWVLLSVMYFSWVKKDPLLQGG
eukprot:206860-Pelagomonas_calceolata.AAC.1